ncbi:Gfo/Idh/MocA family protein [Rathayibacter soli]|uniref:Gfo/Idh/MocA family protein n=1 Tax=Rathayibacter soli TaxID=3144168 RepID=UPI0027E50B49|nr:Gfo/Idh/MocA family oxidoreductase [Glaciibacter superstes]
MVTKFGMIAASNIAAEALLEPAGRRDDVQVIRVAAVRPGAADAFAGLWEIPRASGDYEDILADADIDAVYVSNAASDHARWTIAALEAGKHVLCEKPIAVSAEEARAIKAAAAVAGRVVMEGFHYRFHPFFGLLEQLVASGRFGNLRSIRSVINGTRAYHPASILHVAELGGGALLHNGVYGAHWTRLLFDAEPIGVRAKQRLNPSGADSETSAELNFPDGRAATIQCSFDRDDPVSLALSFEEAEVVATGPIGPHHGHSFRIRPTVGPTEVGTVAGRTSFDYQLEEFVRRTGDITRSSGRGDDVVANLSVVEAVRRSAHSGHLERVGERPADSHNH